MAVFIQIDSIKNQRWRDFAKEIDGRKPDVKDPNDVGDAGDNKISEREMAKLEQKIREYYTANPQKDDLGVDIPLGKLVSEAMADVFGGKLNYMMHQAKKLLAYLTQNMRYAGGPASQAIAPLLSQVR